MAKAQKDLLPLDELIETAQHAETSAKYDAEHKKHPSDKRNAESRALFWRSIVHYLKQSADSN